MVYCTACGTVSVGSHDSFRSHVTDMIFSRAYQKTLMPSAS